VCFKKVRVKFQEKLHFNKEQLPREANPKNSLVKKGREWVRVVMHSHVKCGQCKLLKRDNIQNIVSSYKFKVCKCVLLCFFKKKLVGYHLKKLTGILSSFAWVFETYVCAVCFNSKSVVWICFDYCSILE